MPVLTNVNEISRNLPLSANALVVLKRRYLKKKAKVEMVEDTPDMFSRENKAAPTASMIHA